MDALDKALQSAGMKRLPKEFSGRGTWLRAIVQTAKRDGSRSWAIARFNGTSVDIVEDFGSSSQIVKLEHIHPFRYLNELPKFKTDKLFRAYLYNAGVEYPEGGSMKEKFEALVKAACITANHEYELEQRYWAAIKQRNRYRRRN